MNDNLDRMSKEIVVKKWRYSSVFTWRLSENPATCDNIADDSAGMRKGNFSNSSMECYHCIKLLSNILLLPCCTELTSVCLFKAYLHVQGGRQLVKALCYQLEVRGFDSHRFCWDFFIHLLFALPSDPGVESE